MRYIAFRLGLTILLIFVIAGCQATKTSWKTAKSQDTIWSYQDFLNEYPKSRYAKQAHDRLEELWWLVIDSSGSPLAYQQFLVKYPESKFAGTARDHLEEIEWQKAASQNDKASYQDFVNQYPDSHFSALAQGRLDTLDQHEKVAWANTRRSGDIEDYYTFLHDYPDSDSIAQAISRIKSITLFNIQLNKEVLIKINQDFDHSTLHIPLYDIANSYINWAGINVIDTTHFRSGAIILITARGNSKAADYRYKNQTFHLYTGANLSGQIAMETRDDIHAPPRTLTFFSEYFHGDSPIKSEVGISILDELTSNEIPDENMLMAKAHSMYHPSARLYSRLIRYDFTPSLLNLIASIYGPDALLSIARNRNTRTNSDIAEFVSYSEYDDPVLDAIVRLGAKAVDLLITSLNDNNSMIQHFSARALERISDQHFGSDAKAWKAWWLRAKSQQN